LDKLLIKFVRMKRARVVDNKEVLNEELASKEEVSPIEGEFKKKKAEKISNSLPDSSAKYNYLNGVLGAIAGAIVGFFLWIAIAYFVGGNLHLAFSYVLAVCVFYGYFLARGKNGRGFYPIFISVSILVAVTTFFTAITIEYLDSMDIIGTESFAAYARASFGGSEIRAYLDTFSACFTIVIETFGNYLKDFLVMLIFVSMGVVHYSINKDRMIMETEKTVNYKYKISKKETSAANE